VARGGLLFLAASIADVALLRALGMPATLAGGLRRLTLSGLGHLQGAFPGPGLDDPLAPRADEFDGLDPDDGPESRLTGGPPSLVIVGWSPRALSDRPSPTLGHAARHLDAARRYLSYRFGGVSVWKPSPQEIDSFRYRFRFRSAPQVALAFRNSADNMYDLAVLAAGPPAPPPVFATAQAALVDALAAAGTRSLEDLGSRAQADYDAAVRRVLVKPLLSAASRGLNPIGRASIVQLALTADLLFGMAPHVKTLLVRALTDARGGGEAPFPDKILYQFSRLSDQFRALTNQVQRLQGPDL
jgi:hypothetical protein